MKRWRVYFYLFLEVKNAARTEASCVSNVYYTSFSRINRLFQQDMSVSLKHTVDEITFTAEDKEEKYPFLWASKKVKYTQK